MKNRLPWVFLALTLVCPGAYSQTLKDAVKAGLAKSPSVQRAIADASKSCYKIDEVRAANRPQMSVNGGGGAAYRDRSVDGFTSGTQETLLSREMRLSVEQLLFDFGTTRFLAQSAEFRKQFHDYLIQDVREEQARLVAETYLEVYKFRLHANALRKHLSVLTAIRDDASNLDEIEGEAQTEILEGRLDATRSKLAEVVARIKGLESRFRLLTCMDPTGSMQLTHMPANVLDHVCIEDSPRVKAACLAIEVAKANLEAANRDRLPKVYLQGRGGLGENVLGIEGADNEWAALLSFRWTPSTGGRKKAIVAQQEAEVRSDMASRDDVVLTIKDTVCLVQAEIDGAKERRARLMGATDRMSRGIRLYRDKLDAGGQGVSLLGLANAERERLSVEFDAIDALIDCYIGAIRGLEASGGLLKYLDIKASDCCSPK